MISIFFTLTGAMAVSLHGAISELLKDGEVLIAGGFGDNFSNLESAELFDESHFHRREHDNNT